MWNMPLPFKRGLHLEMAWFEGKYPYLEVGLYNWNTCRHSILFKIDQTLHKDNTAKIWGRVPLFHFNFRRQYATSA